jgi:glycosyltransferase involved in cell wall biosynthesis
LGKSVKYSVIVPCYNEAGGITSTMERLMAALSKVTAFEVIVVDDGSDDGTGEVIESLKARYPALSIIRHNRNRGYGAALKSGIRESAGELILIIDADGTYPPEEATTLIDMLEDADMVVGARIGSDVSEPWLRALPKRFLRWYCTWIAEQPIPDFNSGMRLFKKDIAERFLHILPDGFSFTTTITLAMMTNYLDVRFVPISYAKRIGRSKIRPIRDTLKFIELIVRTGCYFAPLRVFLPVGLALGVLSVASFLYDVFVLKNLTDKTVLLLLFTLNTFSFALLADMIDKRTQ